jgi:hypothetical protein
MYLLLFTDLDCHSQKITQDYELCTRKAPTRAKFFFPYICTTREWIFLYYLNFFFFFIVLVWDFFLVIVYLSLNQISSFSTFASCICIISLVINISKIYRGNSSPKKMSAALNNGCCWVIQLSSSVPCETQARTYDSFLDIQLCKKVQYTTPSSVSLRWFLGLILFTLNQFRGDWGRYFSFRKITKNFDT